MGGAPAVPDPQHLRASDADRERVAETLREAAGDGRLTMDELDERLDAVYKAKTYAELVPITHDLPDNTGAASVPAPARPAAGNVRQYGGEPTSHTAVAILGGFSRKGDWVVPKTFNAFMLLGGGEIDLRDARFAEREVSIHVVAILGGCEITVPEDATVNVNGVGIMGAFEHSAQGGPGSSGNGPVINISGVAFMGGVDVTRKPPKKTKQEKLEAKRRRELD
jgi:Domain of unknown function (DUF1707)/Cell wall-active antibiotics response 4TMS YvqF